MAIDTAALLVKLNAFNAAKAKAKMDKDRARKDKLRGWLLTVEQSRRDLLDLWPVVKQLNRNNKKIYTEGIDHNPGFTISSNDDHPFWGIQGGGCSGMSLFYSLGDNEWSIKGSLYNSKSVAENFYNDCNIFSHAKQLAEEIEDYKQFIVDHVNSLCA